MDLTCTDDDQFSREGSDELMTIDIDHPTPEHEDASIVLSKETDPEPEAMIIPSIAGKQKSIENTEDNRFTNVGDEWTSPAFRKRVRTSYGSLFDNSYDPFAEADGQGPAKKRKRTTLSGIWRYNSRSPSTSPEAEEQDAASKEVYDFYVPSKTAPAMADEGCQTTGLESNADEETLAIPSMPFMAQRAHFPDVNAPQHVNIQDDSVLPSMSPTGPDASKAALGLMEMDATPVSNARRFRNEIADHVNGPSMSDHSSRLLHTSPRLTESAAPSFQAINEPAPPDTSESLYPSIDYIEPEVIHAYEAGEAKLPTESIQSQRMTDLPMVCHEPSIPSQDNQQDIASVSSHDSHPRHNAYGEADNDIYTTVTYPELPSDTGSEILEAGVIGAHGDSAYSSTLLKSISETDSRFDSDDEASDGGSSESMDDDSDVEEVEDADEEDDEDISDDDGEESVASVEPSQSTERRPKPSATPVVIDLLSSDDESEPPDSVLEAANVPSHQRTEFLTAIEGSDHESDESDTNSDEEDGTDKEIDGLDDEGDEQLMQKIFDAGETSDEDSSSHDDVSDDDQPARDDQSEGSRDESIGDTSASSSAPPNVQHSIDEDVPMLNHPQSPIPVPDHMQSSRSEDDAMPREDLIVEDHVVEKHTSKPAPIMEIRVEKQTTIVQTSTTIVPPTPTQIDPFLSAQSHEEPVDGNAHPKKLSIHRHVNYQSLSFDGAQDNTESKSQHAPRSPTSPGGKTRHSRGASVGDIKDTKHVEITSGNQLLTPQTQASQAGRARNRPENDLATEVLDSHMLQELSNSDTNDSRHDSDQVIVVADIYGEAHIRVETLKIQQGVARVDAQEKDIVTEELVVRAATPPTTNDDKGRETTPLASRITRDDALSSMNKDLAETSDTEDAQAAQSEFDTSSEPIRLEPVVEIHVSSIRESVKATPLLERSHQPHNHPSQSEAMSKAGDEEMTAPAGTSESIVSPEPASKVAKNTASESPHTPIRSPPITTHGKSHEVQLMSREGTASPRGMMQQSPPLMADAELTPTGHDASIELAESDIGSLNGSPRVEVHDTTAEVKLRLSRALRADLADYTELRSIRYHLHQKLDILAIAVTAPPDPVRAKTGPRQYNISFLVTDHSTAPSNVVEVQIFRPYKDALPLVAVGDAVLLRNFQVISVKGRGFALRSDQNDACAWAVFRSDQGVKEPQIRGPPVEIVTAEEQYIADLHQWFGALTQTAREKLNKCTRR